MKSDDQNLAILSECGTATVHEASGGQGALPREIQAVYPGAAVVGFALPVACAPGDNLAIHEALRACAPGDVLVVDCAGAYSHGYFGEVMAVAAESSGVRGLVIDGCVRDSARLQRMDFPVFSRGRCVVGTGKDFDADRSVGEPVAIGQVQVSRGDVVIADADGVVVIPRAELADIATKSYAREERELEQFAKLRSGLTTLEVLNIHA